MCRQRNIAMRDYHESVITGHTDIQIDKQTDAKQSGPFMPVCFAGDKLVLLNHFSSAQTSYLPSQPNGNI